MPLLPVLQQMYINETKNNSQLQCNPVNSSIVSMISEPFEHKASKPRKQSGP